MRFPTPPWLETLLLDPSATDICINGRAAVFADRGEGMRFVHGAGFAGASDLRDWVLGVLAADGKTWDARRPFADATLSTGHRVHVVFPPLARFGESTDSIVVSLRRRADGATFPESPAEADTARAARAKRWEGTDGGSQGRDAFGLLSGRLRDGDSVLIAGATGSGKTTLASDLLSFVPPTERILSLEDVPELQPTHPHFLTLLSRAPNADGFGQVSLRDLLRQALRMRPDRIVLGECRGEEVFELLQVLNTGHRGAVATLHANSARDALRRVELLCQLSAARELPTRAVRELICNGFQWVAHVTRTQGRRIIAEIQRIEGIEGDTILMRPVLREGPCLSRPSPSASTSSSWLSLPSATPRPA